MKPVKVENVKSKVESSSGKARLAELIYLVRMKFGVTVFLASMAAIGTLINYVLYIPSYIGSVHFEVMNQRENPLARFLSSPDSTGSSIMQDATQEVQRHASHLRSSNLFLATAKKIVQRPEFQSLNLTQAYELKFYRKKFWMTRLQKNIKVIQTKNSPNSQPRSSEKEDEATAQALDEESINYVAGVLQDATTVSIDGTDSLSLYVKTFDPNTSKFLVNIEAETYVQMALEDSRNQVTEIGKFLQDRLVETNIQVKKDERDLVEFKKTNNLISLEDMSRTYSERARELQSRLTAEQTKADENENLIQLYSKKLKANTDSILSAKKLTPSENAEFTSLSQKFDTLRAEQHLLSSRGVSESDPKMIELNEGIRNTARELKTRMRTGRHLASDNVHGNLSLIHTKMEELKASNTIIHNELKILERAKQELMGSAHQVPEVEQELFSRTENLKMEYELFSSLKKRLQDIEIQRLATKAPIKIDGLLGVAPREVRVSILLRLPFAILVGFFMGCLLILLEEMLSSKVTHTSDLEAADLQPLGSILRIQTKVGDTENSEEINKDLLVSGTRPNSPAALGIKSIREGLRLNPIFGEKLPRSFTISGTERKEGKSVFAINFAISFAKLGKKVLLLDCDLENPAIHKYFDLENEKGLSVFLEQRDTKLESSISHTRIQGLDVMAAGPTSLHPTELIGSDRFKLLVTRTLTQYDYVVFDTPPAVFISDASIVAGLTDAVILVSRYRVTEQSELLAAHRKIFQMSGKRAYGVLTDVPEETVKLSFEQFKLRSA